MDNIVESPFHKDPTEIPEIPLADFLLGCLAKNLTKLGNDAVWFEDSTTGNVVLYKDVEDHTRRIASALSRLGFRKGDVLYYVTYEAAQVYLIILAVWRLGGAVRGWFQAEKNEVYTAQLEQSHVRFVLVDAETEPQLRKASAPHHWHINFLSFGKLNNCISIATLLQDDGTGMPDDPNINVRKDVAFIPSTSGSTGPPKGVLHTHYTGLAGLLNTPNLVGGGNDEFPPPMMTLLVNFAIGSFWILMRSIVDGRKVITFGKFNRETFIDTLLKYKPQSVMMYQYIACWLARHPIIESGKLDFLSSVNIVAWVLDPGTVRHFRKHLPQLVIGQGYGMTEIIGVSSTLLSDKDASGMNHVPFIKNQGDEYASSGRLAPFLKAKIVDPATDRILKRGERGELLVLTPCLMLGYLRVGKEEPDLDGCRDKNGWYKTGDLAFIDENGEIVIVERLSYTYMRNGILVAPSDIEAVLQEHPAVHNSGVVGMPMEDNDRKEHVSRAFVVLRPGYEGKTDPEDIVRFVASRQPPHKHLEGGVRFLPSLPMTRNTKLNRAALTDIALNEG